MSYSGLWNGEYGENYTPLGTNNTEEVNNTTRTHLTKLISRGRGPRKMMEIIRTLTGEATGQTAEVNHVQVGADPSLGSAYSGGGVRTVSTVSDLNRVTTAADKEMVLAVLDKQFHPNPYPKDKGGNGGGGKLGRF